MRETLSVSEKGKGRGGGAYGWKRDSSPEKRSIQLRFSLNTKKKRHGWIFIPKLSDENYPLLQLAFNSASLRFQETQQPSKPKIFKISTLFVFPASFCRHQGLASIMQQNQYIHKVKDQVFLFCGIPLSVKDVVNEFFQRLTGWPYYAFLAAASAQLAWQIGTANLSSPADCSRKFVDCVQ